MLGSELRFVWWASRRPTQVNQRSYDSVDCVRCGSFGTPCTPYIPAESTPKCIYYLRDDILYEIIRHLTMYLLDSLFNLCDTIETAGVYKIMVFRFLAHHVVVRMLSHADWHLYWTAEAQSQFQPVEQAGEEEEESSRSTRQCTSMYQIERPDNKKLRRVSKQTNQTSKQSDLLLEEGTEPKPIMNTPKR